MAITAVWRSESWVCGRSLAGIVDSNPAGGTDVCLLSVLCDVSVCHREASIIRKSWPTSGCCALEKKNLIEPH